MKKCCAQGYIYLLIFVKASQISFSWCKAVEGFSCFTLVPSRKVSNCLRLMNAAQSQSVWYVVCRRYAMSILASLGGKKIRAEFLDFRGMYR